MFPVLACIIRNMESGVLKILYENSRLLAVEKPSGMLVHRGWGNDRVVLVDMVRERLGVKTVHPMHRLDRGTSGVVLFALNPGVAGKLKDGFENGDVTKRYLALVRGVPPGDVVVDHPIPRKEGGPRVSAVTRVRRLATAELEPRHLSLVSAVPQTGRLHQVRRHLKHLNHPIIGDANYGKGALNREIRSRFGLERLALHACELLFTEPETGEKISVKSPVPGDLKGPLDRMGLDSDALLEEFDPTIV